MTAYRLADIARIVNGRLSANNDTTITHLCTDSRRIVFPASSLFFALTTPHRNGHQFLQAAYQRGIRAFVVAEKIDLDTLPDAVTITVSNTLHALQQLAASHRQQFQCPVMGITGSNGKTIVKEWIYQLLPASWNIIRSPKSYNSQVGVPLSVWQMDEQAKLAVFEAGISQPQEMDLLQKIIQPDIGIFTNIGDAHQENFGSVDEKIKEKLQLFTEVKTLIYCKDHTAVDRAIQASYHPHKTQLFTWGHHAGASIRITELQKKEESTWVRLMEEGNEYELIIPFTSDAYLEDALHVVAACRYLEQSPEYIREKIVHLKPLSMRLELKQGINLCSLINDSYSSDLQSLEIALDFLLQQQQHTRKTVILSDILQSGMKGKELYEYVYRMLLEKKIYRLITVGEEWQRYQPVTEAAMPEVHAYTTTDDLIREIPQLHFREETILIKGARIFELERVEKLLEQKVHQTVLEINLTALAQNLKAYRSLLQSGTRIMAMVKAFGYGSGTFEIANLLQFHGCDYLAVAYADEGVALRKAGITLPIMVMNPETTAWDLMADFALEPEVFSFDILKQLDAFLEKEGITAFPVHIKIDTGMHRLGFMPEEITSLCHLLKQNRRIKVQTVFSHLVASENSAHDAFTQQQDYLFIKACNQLQDALSYSFLKHLSNSAAIFRHPSMQYDMMRLGIGLYGIDSAATGKLKLVSVSTLKSTIAQIKELKKGETVGYSRRGIMKEDGRIATVRIGYADGYHRKLGNGKGYMLVNGKPAPVIGNVSMDMTMIDITGIKGVKEGDEVIVMGTQPTIEQIAEWCETISYEIMTGISQRVKRVYYEE